MQLNCAMTNRNQAEKMVRVLEGLGDTDQEKIKRLWLNLVEGEVSILVFLNLFFHE